MLVTVTAGARPNFMKVAPVIRECGVRGIDCRFVHTGQHYDSYMSEDFISALGIPVPDANLEVGSGTDGYQVGEVIKRMEDELAANRPDVVVVVGDVNSTLGVAVCASKMFIPLAHVEAGLRSFNRTMPEEINRIATDALADFLFTTEASADANLLREGREEDSIFRVGNTMIDTLIYMLDTSGRSDILSRLGVEDGKYCFVTLHRPSNVDSGERLAEVVGMLEEIARRIDVVIPVHPRTAKSLAAFGLAERLEGDGFRSTAPIGYIDSVTLMSGSRFVLTDSGGIQEETTFLGVPCLTLRGETERPVTVETGTNLVVSEDCGEVLQHAVSVIEGRAVEGSVPPLWDGKASCRIVDVLQGRLS